jgi:hypothetical protein
MKSKPRNNTKPPKDFKKIKRSVGGRKFVRNETLASSVRSKRVSVPTQRIEGASDLVCESLVSLRHYNEKKRLDAINSLIRAGHEAVLDSLLGDVITSLGVLLSDMDGLVRGKGAEHLFRILNNRDIDSVSPFKERIGSLVRAALASVDPGVRNDAILFVKRCIPLGIYTSTDINGHLRALFDMACDAQLFNSTKATKISEEFRTTLNATIEALLNALIRSRHEIESGAIDAGEWTLSAIFSRTLWPSVGCGPSLARFLSLVHRQGETNLHSHIERLAVQAGILKPVAKRSVKSVNETQPKRTTGRSSAKGGVFSRLLQLERDNDSD